MPAVMGCVRELRLLPRLIALLAALTLVVGCASKPKPADDAWSASGEQEVEEVDFDRDPLEIPNRFIFSINLALDTFVFRPVAAIYGFLIPAPLRNGVRNGLRNLRSPIILANDLLQGEWDRAETTVVRFVLNSTVGIAGLFDVAEGWGYPYHNEDFGQTLGSYGVGEMVYLVLPVLGPSSIRDGTGKFVDTFFDPLFYVLEAEPLLALTVAEGIDTRQRNIDTLDELKRDSIDFYARVRSLYRQSRDNAIANGETAPVDLPTPGLYSSEFDSDDEDQTSTKTNQ